MICVQFIFKPGIYDEEFYALDGEIEDFVNSLPGYLGVEKWQSSDGSVQNPIYYFQERSAMKRLAQFPSHLRAKENYAKWYDGYQIVVSEVLGSYGDGGVTAIASGWNGKS